MDVTGLAFARGDLAIDGRPLVDVPESRWREIDWFLAMALAFMVNGEAAKRVEPSESELRARYEALRIDQVKHVRHDAQRKLTESGLLLLIAAALFWWHWRWVRGSQMRSPTLARSLRSESSMESTHYRPRWSRAEPVEPHRYGKSAEVKAVPRPPDTIKISRSSLQPVA